MSSEAAQPTAVSDGRVVQGNIAARIDRLPLTRVQYTLAAITQLFWGIIIDTDGIVSRLYPFVWEPRGMTTFQYSLLYAGNTGLGILIGMSLGGPLCDRFGRKRIMVIAAFVGAIFLYPVAHTNQFGWLLLWNVLYGIGLGLVLSVNNVYLHEIAPPGSRHRLAMRAQLITGVCTFLPGILGILFVPEHYTWFIYVLIIAMLLLVPIGVFFLPESPRWLEQKGRVAEADQIVSGWEARITQLTGKPLPDPEPERNKVVQTEKVPVRELFGSIYGKRVILLLIVWSLGYGGVVYGWGGFYPTYLEADGWTADDLFFWGSIMAPIVRVAAFFSFSYLGEKFERKSLIGFVGLASGTVTLLFLVTHAFPIQVLLLLIHVPLGSLWLFNMYNFTSTSFPTRVRASGYAWSNGVGHTAQIWAPIAIAPIFAATGGWGWLVWVGVLGTFVPSLLIVLFGIKQKGRTLEETAA